MFVDGCELLKGFGEGKERKIEGWIPTHSLSYIWASALCTVPLRTWSVCGDHSSEGSRGLLKARTNESSFWTFLLLLDRIAHCKKDLSWYCCHPCTPSSLLPTPPRNSLFEAPSFLLERADSETTSKPLLTLRYWSMSLPWVTSFVAHNNPD